MVQRCLGFAAHAAGDDGGVRFCCGQDADAPELLAFVDNPFVKSLGVVWLQRDPIAVRLKVGDNAILETEGKYPNLLASGVNLLPVFREMVAGEHAGKEVSESVRIRTTHSKEQHTFSASLAGFDAASSCNLVKCGLREEKSDG